MSGSADHSFVQALAVTLLERAVPDLRAGEAPAAARFTAERLSGAPGLTRLGIAAIGRVLDGQVQLFEHRRFAALTPERRTTWVARWSSRSMPGVSDYLDAVRGLALTWLYEERAA